MLTQGDSVNIRNIEYPGAMYVAVDEIDMGGREMYSKGNSFRGHKKTASDNSFIWSDYSAENPFVFDLWVVDPDQADAKESEISWDESPIKIAHDGSPHTVKLNTVKRQIQFSSGVDNEGDVIVSCEREGMQQRSDRSDWRIVLRAVDGGIQPALDRYLNMAPEAGYLPSVEVSKKLGDVDYRAEVHDYRYYFTAQSGQVFGILYIDYIPFIKPNKSVDGTEYDQYCLINIEYKVNRSGSRYLFKNRRKLLGKAD